MFPARSSERFGAHRVACPFRIPAYDELTVAAGTTTIASCSNLDKVTGYVLKTIDPSSYAGTTAALKFTGVDDASLRTSFVIDDGVVTSS